jgi:hypothetical protein
MVGINESIDASVFGRWHADAYYRPSGLDAWAERRNVGPCKIIASVLADDPNVAVTGQRGIRER